MREWLVDRARAGWAALSRTTGPPPLPTTRNRVFDALLALLVALLSIEYATSGVDVRAPVIFLPEPLLPDFRVLPPDHPEERVGPVLLALVASVSLTARRRYPLAVLWVVTAMTVLASGDEARLTFYAVVIAVYSAALYSQYRVATLLGVGSAVAAAYALGDSRLPAVPQEYLALLIVVPIAFAANGMRTWKLRTDEGLAQMSALEEEQAEALRRAVEHERARIARELHDVVTHNVSVMVIQAGAARKVMAADPDQAREALLAVEAGGRAAMSELRHVMGLLAPDDEAADPLAPQPGLEQVAALVQRVRGTGLPVELDVAGTPRALPPGIGLAAYRVVQEALTNTVKHAAGASASVLVEYRPDRLRVEVTDTGGRPGAATGTGRGLIGLRERLSVYGGTLRTGPRTAGGFRVTALIPLDLIPSDLIPLEES
ncbi:histidine kinase [Actinosynnema sp. NPDC047251]|uniref:sensor histidine kinase n=1 Tax=Saccharothrix espanaensis TaxID=103731 RepID=UPI0002DCC03A|nr:histidine kinase [Saccharothrix espanaensis]